MKHKRENFLYSLYNAKVRLKIPVKYLNEKNI